jgi:hypothetical protein
MGINSNATTNCEPGPPNGEPGFEHSARKDGTSKDDIAIIGTACRLPGGVHDSEALWNMLTQKLDGWSEMPKDRFTTEGFYHPNPSKRGAVGCEIPLNQQLLTFGSSMREELTSCKKTSLFSMHNFSTLRLMKQM